MTREREAREPRETREPLSRERVLDAALALADTEGIDGLSMRRLATELGVEAMSLYHWFRSKDALLGAMLDAVYREVELPPIGGDWRDAMRQTAVSFHDALLRHRWACGLLMTAVDMSEPRMRHMDGLLGRLTDAGLSDALVDHAYHTLESYVVGFTLWQLPILAIADQLPDLAEQFMRQLPRDDYPHLVAHMEYHMAPRANEEKTFEFGLGLLLDGLERLRRGEATSG